MLRVRESEVELRTPREDLPRRIYHHETALQLHSYSTRILLRGHRPGSIVRIQLREYSSATGRQRKNGKSETGTDDSASGATAGSRQQQSAVTR